MENITVLPKTLEVKEPWNNTMYFLLVQKEARKATQQKLVKKLRGTKIH